MRLAVIVCFVAYREQVLQAVFFGERKQLLLGVREDDAEHRLFRINLEIDRHAQLTACAHLLAGE
jgi:hypothetical protein